MKILFIGDINGKPGRKTVKKVLPTLVKRNKIDLVIANVENIAHGVGITAKTVREMRENGVDVCTGGNHTWDNDDVLKALKDKDANLIRPANYPPKTPGKGEIIYEVNKKKVVIINLQGNVFMNKHLDCPFRAAEKLVKKYRKKGIKHIIIDFHAEATSEKLALPFFLDGTASAVIGTHTHIMTDDARVLEKGTAMITDVGMCGSQDSVLGVQKEIIIYKFLTQLPKRHEIEEKGPYEFSAVLIETDDRTGKSKSIKPIHKILKEV